ncbi:cysteine desulfurase family protein [Humibacter albus]|uniref:cysteine desulfurase family protein n=1 Tax=Humibacter albus TaxID=427754 RepID=UPI0003B50755|nr:cysteine desulfurase family protein [Humibacter albus]
MPALYLDAAATTPVRREALEAAWPYLTGDFGNPSSTHGAGLRAASALKDARARVAAVLGCRASDVVFTGGGTEGDNLAVKGLALANPRGRHLVTTATEHEAVLESVDYLVRVHDFEVDFVALDEAGRVSADALDAVLRPDTALASIAYANNEIGTVQPIAELARVAHRAGALMHTDAVQAAGRLPLDVRALGIDALSFSGHKFGAPKGSGAMFVRGGLPLEPVLHGGGQERGRRSGTENVAFAVALATALERAGAVILAEATDRATPPSMAGSAVTGDATAPAGDAVTAACADPLRDAFIARVLAGVPGAALTGHPAARIPGHASFVIDGVNGETVLLELERRGVLASSGSACAAGRSDPSHVLTALGMPAELATTSVRFSWSDATTSDLERAAVALEEAVAAVRAL